MFSYPRKYSIRYRLIYYAKLFGEMRREINNYKTFKVFIYEGVVVNYHKTQVFIRPKQIYCDPSPSSLHDLFTCEITPGPSFLFAPFV